MKIGYQRVSTTMQDHALQNDALLKAGCEEIFSDTISGSKDKRKGLDECFEYMQSGDTLVVWKLDRLGRSLPHLMKVMTVLKERGIHFESLTEKIDTSTPSG